MKNSVNPARAIFVLFKEHDKETEMIQYLEAHGCRIEILNDIEMMKRYIAEPIVKPDSIILIISILKAYQLRRVLNGYWQIHSIYIYCFESTFYERWISTIRKTKVLFTLMSDVKEEIRRNHFPMNIPISPPQVTLLSTDRNLFGSSTSIDLKFSLDYYLSRLLVFYLSQIPEVPLEKSKFTKMLKKSCSDNSSIAQISETVFYDYSSEKPMAYIQQNPYISIVLSKALKDIDVTSLFNCSFLLRDLTKQFQQHRYDALVDVYHSQIISKEDLDKLRNHLGQYFVFPSFLMNTMNRGSITPCNSNSEQRYVVFHIHADPNDVPDQPFASAHTLGLLDDPDQIVFMIGSLFRIDQIEDTNDNLTFIHITLCEDDGNPNNKQFFEHYKNISYSKGEYSSSGFVRLVADLGCDLHQSQLIAFADELATKCTSSSFDNDPDQMDYYDVLAKIESHEKNLESSIFWHYKSIAAKEKKLPSTHPSLIKTYEDIGEMCQQIKNFSEAIKYFQKALNRMLELGVSVEPHLHLNHVKLASAYEADHTENTALYHYLEALALMIKYDCQDQVLFGTIYHNMGNLQQILRNYPLSLGFYQSALAAKQKAYPNINSSIAHTYHNLGKVYLAFNKEMEAREQFEKVALIYKALKMENCQINIENQKLLLLNSAELLNYYNFD